MAHARVTAASAWENEKEERGDKKEGEQEGARGGEGQRGGEDREEDKEKEERGTNLAERSSKRA